MQQTRHPASAKSVNTLSPHPASLEGACPTEGCPQDVSTRLTWEQAWNEQFGTTVAFKHILFVIFDYQKFRRRKFRRQKFRRQKFRRRKFRRR